MARVGEATRGSTKRWWRRGCSWSAPHWERFCSLWTHFLRWTPHFPSPSGYSCLWLGAGGRAAQELCPLSPQPTLSQGWAMHCSLLGTDLQPGTVKSSPTAAPGNNTINSNCSPPGLAGTWGATVSPSCDFFVPFLFVLPRSNQCYKGQSSSFIYLSRGAAQQIVKHLAVCWPMLSIIRILQALCREVLWSGDTSIMPWSQGLMARLPFIDFIALHSNNIGDFVLQKKNWKGEF